MKLSRSRVVVNTFLKVLPLSVSAHVYVNCFIDVTIFTLPSSILININIYMMKLVLIIEQFAYNLI